MRLHHVVAAPAASRACRGRTHAGTDRHHYTPDEIERDLATPAVRAQLEALRARTTHRAFRGSFSWEVDGTRARLARAAGDERAELAFDVADCSFAMSAERRARTGRRRLGR